MLVLKTELDPKLYPVKTSVTGGSCSRGNSGVSFSDIGPLFGPKFIMYLLHWHFQKKNPKFYTFFKQQLLIFLHKS